MKQNLLNLFSNRNIYSLAAISTLLVMSGCGPDAYVPSTVVSDQTAAGDMSLPPKVDIVLGLSNGGTMQNIYPSLQPELVAFANSLQNRGWDYRFVTLSLSEYSPAANVNITHAVAASRYHSNYPESQWLPSFPGAVYTNPQFLLNPSLFTSSVSIPPLDYTYNNGRESGLRNQATFLNRADVKYNPSNPYVSLLRPDAMLAVMTISNGRDTSNGWSTIDPQTGKPYSNGLNPNPVDVAGFVNQMKAVNQDVKYYAIVAHNTVNCRLGGARSGIEYERAAQMTNGLSVDICTTPVPSALDAVAQHLQTQKISFVKAYLVIGTEPNPATIKVYKNGVEIPKDDTNGWKYIGMSTKFTIESPIPMAEATGYMIQLNGTAKLHGNDKARVEYMNAGSSTTH